MATREIIDGRVCVEWSARRVAVSAAWANGYGEILKVREATLARRAATSVGFRDELVYDNDAFDDRFVVRRSEITGGLLREVARHGDVLDAMLELPRGVALDATRRIVTLTLQGRGSTNEQHISRAIEIVWALAEWPLRWLEPFAAVAGAELIRPVGAWDQREGAYVRLLRRGVKAIARVGAYTEVWAPNLRQWPWVCVSLAVGGEIPASQIRDAPPAMFDIAVRDLARRVGKSAIIGATTSLNRVYVTLFGEVTPSRAEAAFELVTTLALERSAYR